MPVSVFRHNNVNNTPPKMCNLARVVFPRSYKKTLPTPETSALTIIICKYSTLCFWICTFSLTRSKLFRQEFLRLFHDENAFSWPRSNAIGKIRNSHSTQGLWVLSVQLLLVVFDLVITYRLSSQFMQSDCTSTCLHICHSKIIFTKNVKQTNKQTKNRQ